LSDEHVVHLISTSFVPVAVNLFQIRESKDETGRFFRSVDAQKHQYQGLWLVSPQGRVLAGYMGATDRSEQTARKVLTELQSGLRAFGPIPPRHVGPTNPYPYRGLGVQPDGGVTLAVIDKLVPRQGLSAKLPLSSVGELKVDRVTLSSDEWATLAPPNTRVGSQWVVPETVGRRFFPLLNYGDTKFRDGGDVSRVQLVGQVVSVRDGITYLAYRGQIAGTHVGTASAGKVGMQLSTSIRMIGGMGVYDIRAGAMLSLTWVWDGVHTGWYAIDSADPPATGRFGALVEWSRENTKVAPQVVKASGPELNDKLADSTPEDALKTFLLALANRDEDTLRAITLPDVEFDWLLRGPPSSPDLVARLKAQLDEKPIRRLKEGDPVQTPNGESMIIKAADVRAGRVVLWPAGAPLPSRVENVGGHWKVLARPFIAARKQAAGNPKPNRADLPENPHRPGM
jgi:hypothetical protein